MPLYTFESSNSVFRVHDKIIVADTSYLIALTNTNDKNHQAISDFHNQALTFGAQFFINVIVRVEFLRKVRQAQFIDAILRIYQTDPTLEARYREKTRIKNKPFSPESLESVYEDIYKDHIKEGDHNILRDALNKNIVDEALELEKITQMNYYSGGGTLSWENLGVLMQATGLAATDSMIANFAFFIDADAIVTTDCDYAQIANAIDVYTPSSIAKLIKSYNSAND